MAGLPAVHKDVNSGVQSYIKLLAAYGKTLPTTGGPGYKAQGVSIRSKLPNQAKIPTNHPSGRPPAGHIVNMLAQRMTSTHMNSKAPPTRNIKEPLIHPGKALVLRSVKAIHLGKPEIKKVAL